MLADSLLAQVNQGRHHAAKADRVIFLFMAGAPSQLELFEPKPELNRLSGQVVPQSFTQGKRFAFIKGDAKLLGTRRSFSKAGQCGMDISEREFNWFVEDTERAMAKVGLPLAVQNRLLARLARMRGEVIRQ